MCTVQLFLKFKFEYQIGILVPSCQCDYSFKSHKYLLLSDNFIAANRDALYSFCYMNDVASK